MLASNIRPLLRPMRIMLGVLAVFVLVQIVLRVFTCVPARGTAADALALGPDAHHALAFTALRCPRAGIRPRRGCRWYARFRGRPGPRNVHRAPSPTGRLVG